MWVFLSSLILKYFYSGLLPQNKAVETILYSRLARFTDEQSKFGCGCGRVGVWACGRGHRLIIF